MTGACLILSLFALCVTQDAGAEQIESGTAVHLALDHFQPVDLHLDLAGAPGFGQRRTDGIFVATQAGSERGQSTGFRFAQPAIERAGDLLLHHHREPTQGELPSISAQDQRFICIRLRTS